MKFKGALPVSALPRSSDRRGTFLVKFKDALPVPEARSGAGKALSGVGHNDYRTS